MGPPSMDDLREEFIAETRETLEILAEQLVLWEKTPDDNSLVDSVFRFVHTVKGSCGFLDLPRLLKLSHAAEEVLSAARDGALAPSTDLVTAVLKVIDRISELTDALETGAAVQDNDGALIDMMLSFLGERAHSDVAELVDDDDVMIENREFDAEDAFLRSKARSVRVSLTLLDKLMNGISDLVLARNEVSRQLRRVNASTDVDHAFGRLSSTVAEMRDAIGLMRMQGIDRLFSTLPRLMRDICVELDKQVDFVIEGNDVEVDREMVEALRDPLTHILRNAADHGIESAGDRLASGKSAIGRIQIVARQSGNQILVEVSDDGRGVDLEKLAAKSIARKLYTPAQWQKLSERAKLETIFLPGLSTADTVSAISGRGVGMDVVRTNIHAIGGTIDLENHEGRGMKVTLRLPLTLSIIAGLSVTAAGQTYGISRSSVVEILSIKNRNVEIEDIGGMAVAKVRGVRMAYAKLETLLNVDVSEAANETSRTLVIVRPAVGAVFALDVEAVVDNEELVVKPGAPLIMATGLYAGTTLPDNGRPMLLLDTSGLAAAVGAQEGLFGQAAVDDSAAEAEQVDSGASALLFEAADGVRRALRLSVVDRMEDIGAENIHEVGGRLCVSIHEKLFDLHGLDAPPSDGLVKLLRISDGQDSKYLAVEEVIDIFTLPSSIEPSARPDICEGVVHFEGAPIELINAYQYFEMGSAQTIGAAVKPLCFIETGGDDGWETRILQPLLSASGYTVSFDEADRGAASVILSSTGNVPSAADDRMLHLRRSVHPIAEQKASIYRYDRLALISAIQAKLAGAY
jgi:two-component system, chemotaxis family, sensor kinase CheA